MKATQWQYLRNENKNLYGLIIAISEAYTRLWGYLSYIST